MSSPRGGRAGVVAATSWSKVLWGGQGGTGEGTQVKGRLVLGAQQRREGSVDQELAPGSGERGPGADLAGQNSDKLRHAEMWGEEAALRLVWRSLSVGPREQSCWV